MALPGAAAAQSETCRGEQDFLNATELQLGRVAAGQHPYLQSDTADCPGPDAKCRIGRPLSPGQVSLLGKVRPGYVCVLTAAAVGTAAGWLATHAVGPATAPVDAAPPLAAWTGTWWLYDNRITLRRQDDTILVNGEAYWPAKDIMPANQGGLSGTAKPSGNRLHIAEGSPTDCETDLLLAGPFMIVGDNRNCGGHNVSFSGVYTRRRAITGR